MYKFYTKYMEHDIKSELFSFSAHKYKKYFIYASKVLDIDENMV